MKRSGSAPGLKRAASATTKTTTTTSSTTVSSEKYSALASRHSALRATTEGLERERNFYFDKLRNIEEMLQEFQDGGSNDASTVVPGIFQVLYATSDGEVEAAVKGEGKDASMVADESMVEVGGGMDSSLTSENENNTSLVMAE